MVDRATITQLCQAIARTVRPERIILFGSYAYGQPSAGSDVDLLVILRFRGNPVRKAAEILEKVDPRIGVDLLVRTPAQVRRRLAWNDFFMREIVEKGKVIYDTHRARVG